MVDAAPTPRENQGQPVPRIDARLKVTGEARYPADIAVGDLTYGVLVTSPIALGTITTIDFEAARKVPGVLDVLTHENSKGGFEKMEFGNTGSTSITPLQDNKILHDGQIVALVVAESFEAADEAAALVRVTYAPKPPSATFDSKGVTEEGAAGKSEQYEKDVKAGDFAGEWAKAEVKIDANYSTPTQHHNPIELFSTTAAWSDDGLTVYEPSQNVNGWRATLAKQVKADPTKVRIVSPYIGGAFGSKGPMTPRTALVAYAAKRLGRPIRVVVKREQAYSTQTYRAETRHHIQMGATKDGKITAFNHEGREITSRPDPYVVGGTTTTGRMYGYGSVLTKVSMVHADRNTPSYMRSPPETPYVYALENAMDEMAVKLGMDPVEFRRLNDTMNEPIEGKPFSSRSLMQCFDEASKAFGWSNRDAKIGSMRDGDWIIGMGCATAIYPTNVAPCTARVRLTADGSVRVQTAAHEIGTGVRTIAAQLAAERLGVEVDKFTVEMGDSNLPPAPVAGGSNSTASICSTIIMACDQIRARISKAATTGDAGPLAGSDPALLDYRGGQVTNGIKSVSLTNALKTLGAGAVEEYAEFSPKGAPDGALGKLYQGEGAIVSGDKGEKVKFAFGAEFVEIRINSRTREIRVPRITGAFAAGRIMNTRTARSQLMGGMIWGISCALHEITEIDTRAARYVNRDLQDYLVPVNADIGQVDVILVPEVDADVNPAGVKGLGELGNVGTPAAIASAVYHATGKRFRDLPIRVDDLFI